MCCLTSRERSRCRPSITLLDGRITLSMIDGQVEIKYQHLNPATHFQEVVETARSVVLAGGTMSPVRLWITVPKRVPYTDVAA